MRVIVAIALLAACGPERSEQPGPDAGDPPCVNLECKQVVCENGARTRLLGTVRAPTAVDPDPLPNITVYVPNAAVEPFASGTSCMTCANALSGSPLVQTTTATDGTFALENMPVGDAIPIVIQTGRWRRQVSMKIDPCVDNTLPDELSHLPRNRSEGDIPKMAIVTGQIDPLECTLAKLLDPNELGMPGGASRIHVYRRNGNDLSPSAPSREALVGDLSTLLQYDAVLLPCPSHEAYTAQEAANLKAYADQGGRIFNTHGGGFWMFEPANVYGDLVAFNNQPDPDVDEGAIDTSFDKGKQFADWLQTIGATTTYARIPIGAPQWFVDSVKAPAQAWVTTSSPTTVQHLTFNTPIDVPAEQQCGRVLFSNFHVSGGSSSGVYPNACTSGPLTPDEQIIEFMLFDVTACVQPDLL